MLCPLRGVGLRCLIGLRSKPAGHGPTAEEAGKHGVDQGAKYNLGTTIISSMRVFRCEDSVDTPSLRQSQPKYEDEFEGVVECFGLSVPAIQRIRLDVRNQ